MIRGDGEIEQAWGRRLKGWALMALALLAVFLAGRGSVPQAVVPVSITVARGVAPAGAPKPCCICCKPKHPGGDRS